MRPLFPSVSDKTGVASSRGARLARRQALRPGRPARLLAGAGLAVTEVAEHHRLSGDARRPRKTLHRRSTAACFARRGGGKRKTPTPAMAATKRTHRRRSPPRRQLLPVRGRTVAEAWLATLADAIENTHRRPARCARRRRTGTNVRRSPTRRSTPASVAELNGTQGRRGELASPSAVAAFDRIAITRRRQRLLSSPRRPRAMAFRKEQFPRKRRRFVNCRDPALRPPITRTSAPPS